ncbi:MAG: MFS transporter [Candidatus Babeliales bacterium]|jgi:DHA1 family tetracycline resistance protein-like MFS transporter
MKIFKKYASLSSILLMFFIDYVGIGIVYPIFSSMIFNANSTILSPETSQATRGLILGIIIALMPAAKFFSGPILGSLSDRIGRKRLILTSISFGALGYIIALAGVWSASLSLLALSRIMVGIAAGNEAVGSAAIADVSTPENKAKHFGLTYMVAGFGFAFGPFLGGKLSTMNFGIFTGYAVPFLFAALLSLINILLAIFLFKETRKITQISQAKISFGIAHLGKAWRMAEFYLLFLSIFFYFFGWSFYWEFIQVNWIKCYKLDASMIGNFYSWGALFYAISAGLLVQPIVSRFKPERTLLYALIACASSLAIPLLFAPVWAYWIYIPIQQSFGSLIFPVTGTIISNKCSGDTQGEIMGIFNSVQSLALILSPCAGVLLGLSIKMPLIVGAVTLLLAALILNRSQHVKSD